MHILWWILIVIFSFMGLTGFIGMINPDFFNKDRREGQKPFTRKIGVSTFIISLIFIGSFSSFIVSATHEADDQSQFQKTSKQTIKVVETEKTVKQTDAKIKTATDAKAEVAVQAAVVLKKKESDAKAKAEKEARAQADAETQGDTQAKAAQSRTSTAVAATPAQQQATIQILSVSDPAPRNSEATLTARVTPGATAYIAVHYESGDSTAQGLEPKQADANGDVSWSWHVGGRTTLGTWPITVTCNGASSDTQLTVVH